MALVTQTPTRFTDLVGCRHPVQLAAMSGIATAALAAAVSNAGGLGMIGVGRSTRAAIDATLADIASLTARGGGVPVGAGFIVEFLDRELLDAVVDQLPVIEFFWGRPDPALVPAGRVTGWQVGSVDEALAAVDAGCRYVVAQGVEAGGHVRGTIALTDLLPAVRAALDDSISIVAAGGIGTAAHARRAFDLGADAVRVGTRFVAAEESNAHPRYVERLAATNSGETTLTEAFGVNWPDAPHRVLTSSVMAAEQADPVVGAAQLADGSIREIPRWFVSPPTRNVVGDVDAMALYAGEGSTAWVTGPQSAATILSELLDDGVGHEDQE